MKSTSVADPSSAARSGRARSIPLLARGFRPFFLLAALYAVLFVPVWALIATGRLGAPGVPAPSLWHAHEMVYGFVVAAAAGFLLTAVPAWTGARAVSGLALAALAGLWMAARISWVGSSLLPAGAVLVADLAFPCALLVGVAPPLLRSAPRNLIFLPVLALLAVSALGFHLEPDAGWPITGARAARLAIDAVSLLVVLIGGRIVPSFTHNALVRAGSTRRVRESAALAWVSLFAMWSVAAVDALALSGAITGWVRGIAAATLAARTLGWQPLGTLRDPLVWSLHGGFAWLPIGLALLALSDLGVAVPAAAGLHAVGAGCFGTLILAVMTRVALGHTGRPLVAPPGISWAYLMVIASAALRIASVLGGALWPPLVLASAVLFAGGYAAFLYIYAPILVTPRVDGREG